MAVENSASGARLQRNKRFFKNFHQGVLDSGKHGTVGGQMVTMRIIGVNVDGREYLLPSWDPDAGKILSGSEAARKYKPLIESGQIVGYDSADEAEADRRIFYPQIVGTGDEQPRLSLPEAQIEGGAQLNIRSTQFPQQVLGQPSARTERGIAAGIHGESGGIGGSRSPFGREVFGDIDLPSDWNVKLKKGDGGRQLRFRKERGDETFDISLGRRGGENPDKNIQFQWQKKLRR